MLSCTVRSYPPCAAVLCKGIAIKQGAHVQGRQHKTHTHMCAHIKHAHTHTHTHTFTRMRTHIPTHTREDTQPKKLSDHYRFAGLRSEIPNSAEENDKKVQM